jgi:hypothetical protein
LDLGWARATETVMELIWERGTETTPEMEQAMQLEVSAKELK